jgi:hypothetical protein
MKMFLDDFMVYNDVESHLMKLKHCFKKCKEYKISLNLQNLLLWHFQD